MNDQTPVGQGGHADAEIERRLSAWAAGESPADACPDPAVLTAAEAGVLPAVLAEVVGRHVERCPVCQRLARDLEAVDAEGPTAAEADRIRSRVRAATVRRRTVPARWWWPVPAIAVVALVVALVWWPRTREPVAPGGGVPAVPPAVASEAEAVTPAPALPLEKPAVSVALASALVWRGQAPPADAQYLSRLGDALAPYQSDDYAEAARRLDNLAKTSPTADVLFYRGVSRLMSGAAGPAAEDLGSAARIADGDMARDTAWYLAVALERAGRPDAAVERLRPLCASPGSYQKQACGGLLALQSHRR